MKASGVEVLGEIPAHWEVRPIRQLGRIMKGVGGSKEDVVEEGVPCVRYGDLYTTHGEAIEAPRTYLAPERAEAYTSIQYGDLLFAASGEKLEEIGKSAVNLIRGEARCGGDMIVLRPSAPIVPKYLGYAADAAPSVAQKTMMGRGTTVKHIYPDELRNLTIAIPPISEQALIADFLDTKSAAIDALIERQERLLALLAEKRQVVITEAVTKGLDPSVPMKDSGVDWIGSVPAHWRVIRLAMIATRIGNGFVGPTRDILVDAGVPYLQSLHIKGGAVRFLKPYYVEEDWLHAHEKARLREGDLVIVQTGAVGQCASVPQEFHGAGCHALIIVRFVSGVGTGPYFARFFQSHPGLNLLLREQTGALHPHLECGKVRELPIVVPPVSEQVRILESIDGKLRLLDELIDRAAAQGETLREYRQALITAAVTGKLDIPTASAAAPRASRRREAARA
jgi:type I restriction enzyme S subunit